MRQVSHLNCTFMGIRPHVDTSGVSYGRCSGCEEIKHVRADGTVADHNGYDTQGTSVAVIRCPGSGRPPLDVEAEITPASSGTSGSFVG
jgi:hypothetical protein